MSAQADHEMWRAHGAISDHTHAVHILVVTLLLLALASWTTYILQALSVPVPVA